MDVQRKLLFAGENHREQEAYDYAARLFNFVRLHGEKVYAAILASGSK